MPRRQINNDRSRNHLKKLGYKVETVQTYRGHVERYKDWYGIGDLHGVKQGELLIVQATDRGKVGAHWRTIKEATWEGELIAPLLLSVPGLRIVIWGWRKERNGRLSLREREVTLADFEESTTGD